MKKPSKQGKFLKALQNGRVLSRKQVRSQFGLKNPSAAALHLEESGYVIHREYKSIKAHGNRHATRTVKYSIK